MIVSAFMLANTAEQSGIKVPTDPENFNKEEYPHFNVFAIVQSGRPMPTATSHWENARIIADIPDDQINLVTMADLENMGVY